MIVLGIDPGSASGAIAVICTDRPAPVDDDVADIPTVGVKAKKRVNVHELATWIRARAPDHCFVERAQAFSKQGASSGFVYGRATGAIEATVMMLHIPMTIIEPSAWKRAFKLKGGDKESARALAVQLYPDLAPSLSRVMDHGRAEALLIARYGLTLLAGRAVPLPAGPCPALPRSAVPSQP